MGILQEKLKEALDNVNNYIWKGPKVNGVQEEVKLIDCSFEQLQHYYKHCNQMLYNTDPKNPGRITLKNIVGEQIQKCRAELLIRWLRSEKNLTNTTVREDLNTIINNNKEVLNSETIKTTPINVVMKGLPIEFERIPISTVMDATLDCLGIFDNSHLTLNFIVQLGLWFTNKEMQKDLYEKDPNTGLAKNRLEIVARELKIDPPMMLKISDTGLTYAEFKSMYYLRRDKYSNLTSDQLRLLSNKILYRFQDRCELQAKQWEDKIIEIKAVAEYKGWDVTRDI